MKPEQIRAIAQQLHIKLPMATQEDAENFLIAALATINAKAEPVAWCIYISGEPVDTFMHKQIAELECSRRDELYPDPTRRLVPLFLHPSIELAPQTDGSATVNTPDQVQMSRSVGAAPLPDEVATVLKALREHTLHFADQEKAADILERIARERDSYKDMLKEQWAAGVPPDCVVVPREYPLQFYAWLKKNMPAGTVIGDPVWWAKRLYRAMIAAGEVKP